MPAQHLEALERAMYLKTEGPRQREALVGQPVEVVIRALLKPTEELASLRLPLLLGGSRGDARGPIPGVARKQFELELESLPRRIGGWHPRLRLRDLTPLQRERFVVAMIMRSTPKWRASVMLPIPVAAPPVERKRRSDSKLKDRHIEVLHQMHTERGVSIRELGRFIWERAGFASAEAAARAITRAFDRMHLPARPYAESRELTRRKGERLCEEVKASGESCGNFAMVGSSLCWGHLHPEQMRALALEASPWVAAPETEAVAA
jgi:hypothetical protein